MGAQQSSAQGNHSNNPTTTQPIKKTCYYELLAIDRQATDEEIKKAYKRKALELHPDRNFNNVEVATQKFAEVQSAYEVLSDPQERAWYDSHRDAILRGDDELAHEPDSFRNVRLTSTEEILSLMSRFSAAVLFNDETTGFYGISRETFEHLALEELAASEFDGIDCPVYHTFGCSGDDYERVVKPFYTSWAGFSTRKSFAWKDKYRLSDAPDRRIRRLMEKENNKIRDDARKEFNDAVQFLVAFVRKRDPRYLPNTQTDTERQKALRDAAAAQAAKARAANQERLTSYQVPEWAKSFQGLSEEDGHFSDEQDEEPEVEVLECVVCDKIFKSEKQYGAHEKSKKHIKAIQQLRREMRKEGIELNLETSGPNATSSVSEYTTENQDDPCMISDADVRDDSGVWEQDRQYSAEASSTPHEDDRSVSKDSGSPQIFNGDNYDDDYAAREVIQERLFSADAMHAESSSKKEFIGRSDDDLSAALNNMNIRDTPPKKIGKAKAKREKKTAAGVLQSGQGAENKCSMCSRMFPSRTKLFEHIKSEGHAAPIPSDSPLGKSKKKRR